MKSKHVLILSLMAFATGVACIPLAQAFGFGAPAITTCAGLAWGYLFVEWESA